MNKVLITGLGIGNSLNFCVACNMDYSWLIENPATFIWADKICIPSNLFGQYSSEKSKFSTAVELIMNIADDAGVIDKITIPDSYKKEAETTYSTAIEDAKHISECFPEVVKKGTDQVPDEILINGKSFCGPYIASIYASIKLADRIGANCLFNDNVNTFLKYRYGLEIHKHISTNEHKIYNEIFQTLIPNEPVLPEYAYINEETCETCKKFSNCKDRYLDDIEEKVKQVLKWREYDEVYRAKEVIDDIIYRKNSIQTEEDVKEVLAEFEAKKKKINLNINKRFPSIQRWTNLVTICASPVTVYSALSGDATIAAISASAIGLSTAVEKATEVYKSKNNWVGFFDKKK